MEDDYQTINKCFDFHNKSVSKKFNSSTVIDEEKNMEITSNNSRLTSHTSALSLSNTKEATKSSNSPKMGSRRIFTPQFKLQVLESYRNDSDCKGNQRATARKYNIHRRQIQKWLQCESTLRSSVANINQNSVKHQFHNVNLQQTKNITNTSHNSIGSPTYTSNQLHSAHICLDSSSGSVLSNTVKMPSLSTCITTPTTTKTIDRFETSNLATVVPSGTIVNTSSSCSSPGTVLSPLRSATIISANVNTNAAISPLIQHHYTISPFNNIYPQPHAPSSYQYHNMAYTSTLSHHQIEKHQSSYFTPISLSDLSVATSNSNCYAANETEISKAYPKFASDKNVFLCNDNLYHINYERPESVAAMNSPSVNGAFNISQFKGDSTYSTTYPFGPMDLSLRHKREVEPKLIIKSNPQNMEQSENPTKKVWNDNVVDLTNRKRRVDNYNNTCDYINEFSEKYPKLFDEDNVSNKPIYNSTDNSDNNMATSNSNEDDDIEIEVGMEEKFAPSSKPVKLFKPYLLDECENKNNNVNGIECENEQNNQTAQVTNCFSNSAAMKTNISKDDFVRDDTFPDAIKKNSNTCVDSSNFPVESRCESPRSACSPATSVSTMSPTNFQYPKGSPASSGYESSTSTYSDSSLSPRNETYMYGQTYSVKLQMQSICSENINVIHSSKHIQRWLEKDDSKPLTHNSTIALLV